MPASTSYQRCARKRMPVGALARALTSLASVPWQNESKWYNAGILEVIFVCARFRQQAPMMRLLEPQPASQSEVIGPIKPNLMEGANDELASFTGFSSFSVSCVFQGRRCNNRSDSPTSSSATLLAWTRPLCVPRGSLGWTLRLDPRIRVARISIRDNRSYTDTYIFTDVHMHIYIYTHIEVIYIYIYVYVCAFRCFGWH